MFYCLMLNDMRTPKIEIMKQVTPLTEDRQKLVEMYEAGLCEPYTDGQWRKYFKKDGPLEWYNKAGSMTEDNDYFGGVWTAIPSFKIGP